MANLENNKIDLMKNPEFRLLNDLGNYIINLYNILDLPELDFCNDDNNTKLMNYLENEVNLPKSRFNYIYNIIDHERDIYKIKICNDGDRYIGTIISFKSDNDWCDFFINNDKEIFNLSLLLNLLIDTYKLTELNYTVLTRYFAQKYY